MPDQNQNILPRTDKKLFTIISLPNVVMYDFPHLTYRSRNRLGVRPHYLTGRNVERHHGLPQDSKGHIVVGRMGRGPKDVKDKTGRNVGDLVRSITCPLV